MISTFTETEKWCCCRTQPKIDRVVAVPLISVYTDCPFIVLRTSKWLPGSKDFVFTWSRPGCCKTPRHKTGSKRCLSMLKMISLISRWIGTDVLVETKVPLNSKSGQEVAVLAVKSCPVICWTTEIGYHFRSRKGRKNITVLATKEMVLFPTDAITGSIMGHACSFLGVGFPEAPNRRMGAQNLPPSHVISGGTAPLRYLDFHIQPNEQKAGDAT